MTDNKEIRFIKYSLFAGPIETIDLDKNLLISTINQYSYCIAEKNKKFREALQESDILLPDGIAIVWAVRLLTGKQIKKVTGYDIFIYALSKLNKASGRCFFLGSSEATLKKIKRNLLYEFPNIEMGYYSPPFKNRFSEHDNDKIIELINAYHPDVLFVGMTAPKQETWAFTHRSQLRVKVICSIGAVFDFYAGTIKRPGSLWIKFGLEWLGRLLKEPVRLWRRYLQYGPVFVWLMLKEKQKKENSTKENNLT